MSQVYIALFGAGMATSVISTINLFKSNGTVTRAIHTTLMVAGVGVMSAIYLFMKG